MDKTQKVSMVTEYLVKFHSMNKCFDVIRTNHKNLSNISSHPHKLFLSFKNIENYELIFALL